MADARADLEVAFARLVIGEPLNASLKAAAAAGRLRISITSVAIEAGRSRTLIGHEKCPYPDLRQRILKLMEEGPSARHLRHAMKSANRRIAELSRQLAEGNSIQAALVLELNRLRSESEADLKRMARRKGR